MTVEEEMRIQHRLGEKKGRAEGFAEGEKSGFSKGEQSGFSKGEKSGIERGAAQEKREIAKNLKSLKLPTEQIKAATGLSTEEIEAL